MEDDLVAFVQDALIMPKRYREVILLGETFNVSFPVVEESQCKRLGIIGIKGNSFFDERKFVLLVLYHDLQNHIQVIATPPDTLDVYRVSVNACKLTLFSGKCGDGLVERISLGVGIVKWSITANHSISRVGGQTIWLSVFGKVPDVAFIGHEMSTETIAVCLQTDHFGNKVWVNIFFFTA